MLFNAIFLSLFITGWLFCGFLPWLAVSVATRGNAGLAYLPLAMFTGVVAGLAVPVFGANGMSGIWLSFIAALVASALLLAARRMSLHHAVTAPAQPSEHRTR